MSCLIPLLRSYVSFVCISMPSLFECSYINQLVLGENSVLHGNRAKKLKIMDTNRQRLIEEEQRVRSALNAAEWQLQACDHQQNGHTCPCYSMVRRLRDQLSTIQSQIETENRRLQGKVKLSQ
ncbi:GfV-C11-ORF3 [Ichnoviriform fumiferanae]|uniref:GfV-C11-ORF3 n=1 Tax=Ichnoviriform fumiferanae TaxID=419435 RepID=A2PZX8_9VIRU|nr:GfV-C11-ORF3 [Ichnoviriform fumiferanae]BAF45550.1 GfV-C11-ORF3 [Ichnoviriform fumiferanae]